MGSLLWFVVTLAVGVVLVAERLHWWYFKRFRGAFRCRIRALGAPPSRWPRLGLDWSRRTLARWDGDRLIVRRGRFRNTRLAARVCGGVYCVPAWNPDRCGLHPLAIEVVVEDGARLEVAAPNTARLDLVGPYLAAATRNLPEAPVPPR